MNLASPDGDANLAHQINLASLDGDVNLASMDGFQRPPEKVECQHNTYCSGNGSPAV